MPSGKTGSCVDETSGDPVDNYGGELSIAVDRELIKDRVFGALNLVYDPEVTRSRVTGLWQREATLGVLASVTTQVRPGIFVGAEARYLRKYDGLGLDPLRCTKVAPLSCSARCTYE